jgi:cytochrome c-type biogenesis protein CcmF
VAYILCGFVAGTIVQEFYKGIRARQAIHDESLIRAFIRLVGRNRRRYGGYIVHAGIVMLFAAFAGMAFKKESDVTLHTGEAFQTTDPYGHSWKFVSQGVSTSDRRDRSVKAAALEAYRDGKPIGIIEAEKRQYKDAFGQDLFNEITEIGLKSSPRQDIYVVLTQVPDENTAEMRITFNPLVVWVWTGGYLMMIGGLVVMWPQAEKRRAQAGYVAQMPSHATADDRVAVGV